MLIFLGILFTTVIFLSGYLAGHSYGYDKGFEDGRTIKNMLRKERASK